MTTDETIAHYTRLKETHEAHVDPADIKPETLAIWQLLDRISALEARIVEVTRQAQQRSNEHHDLAVEYLEDGKPEMAQSSRTLASCYAKVAEWLKHP